MSLLLLLLVSANRETLVAVTDGANQPIAFAVEMSVGEQTDSPKRFESENGVVRYAYPIGEGPVHLSVVLPDGTTYRASNADQIGEGTSRQPTRLTVPPKRTFGGQVVDEQDEPIADARVVWTAMRGSRWVLRESGSTRTDADGFWSATIRGNPDAGTISVSADDRERRTIRRTGQTKYQDDAFAAHVAGSGRVRLRLGYILSGRVVDPDGGLIAGASVTLVSPEGKPNEQRPAAVSGDDGFFDTDLQSPGRRILVVRKPGYAPAARSVTVAPARVVDDVVLQPGVTLAVRVVDGKGRPIEDARVWTLLPPLRWAYEGRRDEPSWRTDADGLFLWTEAPQSVRRTMFATATGYETGRVNDITPGDEPHTIRLRARREITVRVTDAATGEPIRQARVVSGTRSRDDYRYSAGYRPTRRDGTVSVPVDETIRVRVAKFGYETMTSQEIRTNEAGTTIDVRLPPVGQQTGRVVDSDGRPVARATLSFPAAAARVSLTGGEPKYDRMRHAVTDAEGRFSVQAEVTGGVIVAHPEAGWLFATAEEWPAVASGEEPIRLRRWATVEGRLLREGKPLANVPVRLTRYRSVGNAKPPWADVLTNRPTTFTDADGRFRLTHLFAGRAFIAAEGNGDQTTHDLMTHLFEAVLRFGQTSTLTHGTGGHTIVGRVATPHPIAETRVEATIRREETNPPPAEDRLIQTTGTVDAEGRFRFVNVPPSNHGWRLQFDLTGERQGGSGQIFHTLTLPPTGAETIDVGLIGND